jgi:hypothetical protein
MKHLISMIEESKMMNVKRLISVSSILCISDLERALKLLAPGYWLRWFWMIKRVVTGLRYV